MRGVSWSRVIATGVLSALVVPISWALTLFVTPGGYFAQFMVPQTSDWVLNQRIETAAAFDFALWFVFFWGLLGLWKQFREEVRKRGAAKRWVNPMRCARTPLNAVLCAFPFPFYVVFGVMVITNKGRMPDSAFLFVDGILISLVLCALLFCGLFAVAVRFWPASWLPKGGDHGNVTTLDLH